MKPIPGFEDIYSVTDDGKIYNHRKNIFMSLVNCKGYLRVALYKDRLYTHFYVHRLVAWIFNGLDISNKNLEVDHIDKNKSNNHKSNLRNITHYENALHAHNRLGVDTIDSKMCRICKLLKRRSEFGHKKSRVDGLQSACISCSNEKARSDYKESIS